MFFFTKSFFVKFKKKYLISSYYIFVVVFIPFYKLLGEYMPGLVSIPTLCKVKTSFKLTGNELLIVGKYIQSNEPLTNYTAKLTQLKIDGKISYMQKNDIIRIFVDFEKNENITR